MHVVLIVGVKVWGEKVFAAPINRARLHNAVNFFGNPVKLVLLDEGPERLETVAPIKCLVCIVERVVVVPHFEVKTFRHSNLLGVADCALDLHGVDVEARHATARDLGSVVGDSTRSATDVEDV